MRIYLDLCCYKRGFDDRTNPRVDEESNAIEEILSNLKHGRHELIGSDVLRFENSKNTNELRREVTRKLFQLSGIRMPLTNPIENRANYWQNIGVGMLDSIHLATAEFADVDVFCSCDDVLLHGLNVVKPKSAC